MGTANAATGFFLYTARPGNVRTVLYNPVDDECCNISGQGHALNETNRNAELYAYSDCRGDVGRLLPPDTSAADATLTSVRFVH
ncbi:hypothetical protein ABZ876_22780 [Streptomyces sp. NPDC046931]|uniref:hypothetical protein n=1 Tax=Streptomyces sp. NPDC046931 TaxID=3154806 RepID=UPI0033CBF6E0